MSPYEYRNEMKNLFLDLTKTFVFYIGSVNINTLEDFGTFPDYHDCIVYSVYAWLITKVVQIRVYGI